MGERMGINQGILALLVLGTVVIGAGVIATRQKRKEIETHGDRYKRCPKCDEEIRIKAIVCKHCRSHLESA
jgi:hypothetical protein